MPILTYGMEALIYTQQQLRILDDKVMEAARWQLDAFFTSPKTATLSESGLRTPSELIDRARAAYLLHIIERPDTHLTTTALKHTWEDKKSPRYQKWLQPTLLTLKRWGHMKFDTASYARTRWLLSASDEHLTAAIQTPFGPHDNEQ